MAVSTTENDKTENKTKKIVMISLKLIGMGFIGFLTLYGLVLFARWFLL